MATREGYRGVNSDEIIGVNQSCPLPKFHLQTTPKSTTTRITELA